MTALCPPTSAASCASIYPRSAEQAQHTCRGVMRRAFQLLPLLRCQSVERSHRPKIEIEAASMHRSILAFPGASGEEKRGQLGTKPRKRPACSNQRVSSASWNTGLPPLPRPVRRQIRANHPRWKKDRPGPRRLSRPERTAGFARRAPKSEHSVRYPEKPRPCCIWPFAAGLRVSEAGRSSGLDQIDRQTMSTAVPHHRQGAPAKACLATLEGDGRPR